MTKLNTNPKYSYYLKSVKQTERPIVLKFNFGYKELDPVNNTRKYIPLVYYTGVKVPESEWDGINQIPTNPKRFAEVEEVKDVVLNTYNYLIGQNLDVTPDLLKSELDIIFGKKTRDKEVVRITDYIQKRIVDPEKFDDGTIRHYKVLKGKIETYEKENSVVLTSQNLDRNHYLKFQEKCKGELGKNNSVWGVMKNLKSVLNKIRRDYKHITVFNPSLEISNGEKVKLIYDTKVFFEFDQIQTIINYKPESRKHKNVKLILMTLLFSGCRYSDVFKVVPKYTFDKDGLNFRYARFITEKGDGVEVIIPFLKPLEDAITENGGESAYPITDVKFNKYVKELCKLAELDDEVKIAYTAAKGGKKFDSKPFFQHVSSHIGRRTFISNLISAVPITLLSKVTGHSFNDNDVIFKYDKKTLLQNAVLFVKELRRVSVDRKEEFPIELV